MESRPNSLALLVSFLTLGSLIFIGRSTPPERLVKGADSYRQRIDANYREETMRRRFMEDLFGPDPPPSLSETPIIGNAYSDDVKREVINSVLNEILLGEFMRNSRKFYGQPGPNVVALLTDDEFRLPVPLGIHIPGWKIQLRTSDYEPEESSPRMLLVRIDEFDLEKELGTTLFNGHVEVLMTNGGGSPDGEIHIGGIMIFFHVQKTNGKYEVLSVGAFDP